MRRTPARRWGRREVTTVPYIAWVGAAGAAGGGLAFSGAISGGSAASMNLAAIRPIVVDIGGEGEILDAINIQGPWIFASGFGISRTQASLGQMQAAGNRFVVALNNALPFANGTISIVYTNSVPIGQGQSNFLGPLVQPSEIWRILTPIGVWINNGSAVPRP